MYKNKVNKCFNNSQLVYSSMNDSSRFNKSLENRGEDKSVDKEVKYDSVSIDKKIDDIFNAKDYVYKADVKIVTDGGIVNKRIVARNRTNLITIDNEYIPISMIRDIYK